MSSLGSARKGPSLQRPLVFHGGLAWRPLLSAPTAAGVSKQAWPRRGPQTQSQDSARLPSGPSVDARSGSAMKGPAQSQDPIPGPASGAAPHVSGPARMKSGLSQLALPLTQRQTARSNSNRRGGISVTLRVCVSIWFADPARLTALGPDRLGAYFGDGFLPVLQVSVQQHQQTLRGSYNLSLRVWNGLAL
ncbi:hypothetical protein NDU88_000457 [Pleurodeles waltl]|uniref:Uncharacterized protein n=1 Tax=Pleurodeles waltl TaxID=8319 RepID=A0AAV7NBY4_PLEWA|nr:hypothetical protein NDU88_000457 [Pleurodeles waltl]